MLPDKRELVAGKRGATRLGFALLLKFYANHGKFPQGDDDLPGEVVEFVALQVPAADLAAYVDWPHDRVPMCPDA